MNANDAALTGLTTARTGSTVAGPAPNAPAGPGFDPVLAAAAGSALGSCGARYTLTTSAIDLTTARQARPAQAHRQAFDAASGWEPSGPGPDHQCIQTFPVTIPGGAGGPRAGHVLQHVASPVGQGAQIASIIRSHPFVLAWPTRQNRQFCAAPPRRTRDLQAAPSRRLARSRARNQVTLGN